MNNLNFKRGSYSALLAFIVIAIVLVVNLAARQLPSTWTSLDISQNEYYSVGDTTEKILDTLNQDVYIYQIIDTTTEDSISDINTKILEKYAEMSEYIHVETIDPELNTTFLAKYNLTSDNVGSIIVESSLRYKIIDYYDIYETITDYTTYESTSSYDGEGEITSAIDYVTTAEIPNVYTLAGHGEEEFDSYMTGAVEAAVFNIETLSLIEDSQIPEDCSILMILAPTTDLSLDEATIIINYLENGGKVIMLSNYSTTDMPNFKSVLEAYGVELVDGVVIDENTNNNAGYVDMLLPNVNSHEITQAIVEEGLYVYMPVAQGIEVLDSVRSTLNFASILDTSEDSYSLTDGGESANTTGVLEQGENDPSGPFSLGMIITEEVGDETTELAVYSTGYMILEDVTQNNSVANISLFVDTLKWMNGNESTISIEAKSLNADYNIVSSSQMISWSIIFVLVIPITTLVVGLVIWIKRRKA